MFSIRIRDVWIYDKGSIVDLPEERYLRVPLCPNYLDSKLSSRHYQLSKRDRDAVDEVFDRLHQECKMKWTDKPTPFAFPVFVAWRTMNVPGSEKTIRNVLLSEA